ncbi:hypothetical protein HK098_003716 [Nowakowskiella sp. JEL0407]|nr:hypothetical protein HK098_003716 [Nowakowskiella sp. JEL0407]
MNSTSTNNTIAASSSLCGYDFHMFLPQELGIECEKAREIITEFTQSLSLTSTNHSVPPQAFLEAKAIIIISVLKVGSGWSGRIGSGIVISKLASGSWSAPCAVSLLGVGYGPQWGASVTDFVYLLTSDAAVKTFKETGQVSLGAQFAVVGGSTSKVMETSTLVKAQNFKRHMREFDIGSHGFCYAKSKGLYIGVSLEGAMFTIRKDANQRFYSTPDSHPETDGSLTSLMSFPLDLESATAVKPLYLSLEVAKSTAINLIKSAAESYASFVPTHQPSSPIPNLAKPDGYVPIIESQKVDGYVPVIQMTYPDSGVPSLPIREEEQEYAVAIFDYEAIRPTDVSFKKGDIIVVLEKSDTMDDWWLGRVNGKEGRFPANRTKITKIN